MIVDGARQTGKSYIIRYVGKKLFKNYIELNFEEDFEGPRSFQNVHTLQDFYLQVSMIAGNKMGNADDTIIFLDEIQRYPHFFTLLKFLREDNRFTYIASGSLLGVELNDLRSEPVGYMDVKEMFPLDLEEFFMAMGVSEQVMDSLKLSFDKRQPVDGFVHSKMMELFRLYLIVGGMPAAVQKYVDTHNLQQVMAEQQAIVRLYKRDIAKYDRNHKLYLEEIFDLIPSELNAKNKRFILKDLNENMKFTRYENSFLWLKNAGVALPTYNVEEPVVPLKLSRSRNLFKLFQNDIGLLASQYAEGIQLRIIKISEG